MQLQFGRPGHGAPLVSPRGELQTTLVGDPNIRFREMHMKNMAAPFRYMAGEDRQKQYKQELDTLVLQKAQLRQQRRAEDRRLEMETVRSGCYTPLHKLLYSKVQHSHSALYVKPYFSMLGEGSV